MALITLDDIRTPNRQGFQLQVSQWQICEGETWALLGDNGAGKTLLIDIVRGAIPLARGEVSIAASLDPRQDIAVVSFDEQKKLYDHDQRFDDSESREDGFDKGTTVRRFILGVSAGTLATAMPGGIPGVLEDRPELDYWAEKFHIQHIMDSGIRFVSTGEMRKALLIRALLTGVKLLVLDSPLDGLDRQTQSEMKTFLAELLAGDLHRAAGLAPPQCILLLPGLPDVATLPPAITHVLALAAGKVVANGAVSAVGPQLVALKSKAVVAQQSVPMSLPLPIGPVQSVPPVLLNLHKVNVSFNNTPVLRDVSWQLRAGQHTVISGPNGCGKSTLLDLITGENPKAYGQHVVVCGEMRGAGESIWALKQKFGVVSAALQTKYVRGFNVIEVVLSGFSDSVGLYAEPGDQQCAVALEWLQALGMGERAQHKYQQLSFGEQRLVLLARAMVKQPLMLLLDEPCIGLDARHRARFLALLAAIANNGHSHLIYVSHVVGEAPACINQWLDYVPHPDGGYGIEVRDG